VLHDDATMVTVNWNGSSTQRDGRSFEYCGIEVFRVVDGKIVEIWNSRETGGHWQPSRTF
jgi:ketosteroid isomerase-like protein